MTLPSRLLRMSNDGFRTFATLPVRTVTIGFTDRPATGDSILIAIPQTEMGYVVRLFCALTGGEILVDNSPRVHTDITLISGFISINVPEVTEGQNNYSGWLVVELIPMDPLDPIVHGEDAYSVNDS